MALAYHLALGGTRVTFYVRPSRVAGFPKSRLLYCYEDASTRTVENCDVVGAMSDVQQRTFDFVVVTLDGPACRSVEGATLLAELADAIRASDAVMILCGVSLGLHEYALRTTGLSPSRVRLGTLAYLAHETTLQMPDHPAIDTKAMARADFAYSHDTDRTGFTLARSAKAPAQRFAELIEQAGVERCAIVSPSFYAVFTAVFYPFIVASKLGGWLDADRLEGEPELVSLGVAAMKEIAGSPGFGPMGRRVAAALSESLVIGMYRASSEGFRPLDLATFNRHHHGGKVLEQGIAVLRDSRQAKAVAGHLTPALDELLRRHDA